MRIKDKPYYLFLLSLLSGWLFWLGWPTKPTAFFLFFAFVPLLAIEDHLAQSDLKKKGWKFLGHAYVALLTWNVLTTYWIYNATAWGGMFAMAANAALMCIPLMLFHFTRRATNSLIGYSSFVIYWISFEYWHLNWELSWPWLTLGNGFSSMPGAIQWYEYTGALGGTLWILACNVCIFSIVKAGKDVAARKKMLICFMFVILIPLAASLLIGNSYTETGREVEVIVVQPNIDPYTEKFQGSKKFIPYDEQLRRLITLSRGTITPETRYVVWPETALPYGYLEANIMEYPTIQELKRFVHDYPNISLVTGLDTFKELQTQATPAETNGKSKRKYEAFNSAIQINEAQQMSIYHKSRLVPGVEYMPPALTAFAIAVGESAGGLGTQKERTVFFNQDSIGIGPVICYESIFGEFVTEYVKKGANMIFIITNDGWWGNTQGHKQHILFGALRAIENRKCIARSANTGISGFIDQKGTIVEKSKYWEQDVMKMRLRENGIKTFYTLHGDYIGYLSLLSSFVFIITALIYRIKKRKQ